ncbi:sugar porter family MFS transporter [Streptomyces sp. BBFR2]|uniref:sugar porter family MFS transporter n=1 Tax=Streptomyces sp. BBFR2 TaxID=3372854 RepID=UPI0037DA238E
MVQGFSREPGTEGPLDEVPPAGLRKIRRWASVIALGGFLFGFDTGVVSGALLFIKRDFGLDAAEQGAVVSVLLIGAMAGALGAGRLAERLGRRKALALEGTVFLIGTALAVLAPGFAVLLVARVVLGLAVGAASATVPVYLSEISPPDIRGRVLSANQLMITVGILVAYLINLAFAGSGNWRAMFAVGAVPAVLVVAGAMLLLPESPQWLILHDRPDRARKIIASVTNDATADRLLERARQRRARHAGEESGTAKGTGRRALLAPAVRPALIVGLTLAAVQQFGGINTIIYYAPTIIEQTGLTASNSIFYSVFIGVVNLAMTLVAIHLIDRWGRRRLMLISLTGMGVTLVLLGLSFVAGWGSGMPLVFMLLYIIAYSGGLGPVFWVLVGELFPPAVRSRGSSVSTTTNWASNFVVGQAFLPVVQAIGQGPTFWIFAAVCAGALLFVARFVPETKGRTFEEVDAALRSRFHPHTPAPAR